MTQSLMSNRNSWLETMQIGDRRLSLMDHLFNRLDGMYPIRWRSAFPGEDSIRNWREAWADAFVDAQLTPQHVAAGIRACVRQYDWPPSIAEFVKACRPQLDAEAAFAEACEQMRARESGCDQWSHRAVYWAAVEFGTWNLRNSSWQTAKARWIRIFEAKLRQDDLPEVPGRRVALVSPRKGSADQEMVAEIMQQCKQIMRNAQAPKVSGA